MDEEVFEKAKEEDLNQDEAEELQDFIDETGLDIDACPPLAESLRHLV